MIDFSPRVPTEIPIYRSSFCSLINYTWMTSFIWRTYRKGFVASTDIWPYPKSDSCQVVLPDWEHCVLAEIKRQKLQMPGTLIETHQGSTPSPVFNESGEENEEKENQHNSTQTPLTVVKNGDNQGQSLASLEEQKKKTNKRPPILNLVWAVLRFQSATLFSVLFLRLATLVAVILSAMFGLRTLIREVEDGNMDIYIGIIALVALIVLLLCKSILWSQAFCIGGIAGVRLRGAVLLLCLHKLLQSKSLLSIRPTITNIFANDSRTFLDLQTHITQLISAFTMVAAVSVCGWFIIGPWSLMATAVFLVYMPIEYLISRVIMKYRFELFSIIFFHLKSFYLYSI